MATTLEAIQARLKKLQAQADALMTKETAKVLATIHRLMEEHGLTASDIGGHAGGKPRAKKVEAKTVGKRGTVAVKYRDPKSGATWSGRGRAPQWIASAKNRDRFLVEGSAATTKSASPSKAKVGGNYVRGPQPAMYRDPKSGATWSGRGRAPTWIAAAKDRNMFLIADGVSKTSAGAASKTKPSAKKAVAKRAAVKKVAATKTAPTTKVAAKKVVSAKVPVRKAPAKDTQRQSVAEPAPVTSVEPSTESAT
ncbi:H-NS family nucleoid-associated regulatory protein [Paraburkholderia sp. RL17-380-BIE-A]|uniref:H-NS family nucleoid-associated regulatory protein n=1 Tax=Paraburkholderia sp. RL17-380-BIE-A TaxID=3031630 RepID=UPI0038BA3053